MNKPLLLRELRRQAPLAGGAALLAILAVFAVFAFPENLQDVVQVAILIGFMAMPGFLAVATVAPDAASGGLTFLARMPIAPSRTLAAKALVAVGLAAMLVGVELGALSIAPWARLNPWRYDEARRFVLPWAVYAFTAGFTASVIAPRPLTAALVAPILGVLGLLAGQAFGAGVLDVWYSSEAYFLGMAVLLAVPFLFAATTAFLRGEPHRTSLRPAGLALASFGLAFLPLAGGTKIAHAWSASRVAPELAVRAAVPSPDGQRLAVILASRCWTGLEERLVVVDRPTGATWLVPLRNAIQPEFASDGRRLLARTRNQPEFFVLDCVGRSIRRLETPDRHATFPVGEPHPVWIDFEGGSGIAEWKWAEGSVAGYAVYDVARSPSGKRALVRRPDGLAVRDLASGREVPLATVPSTVSREGETTPSTWGAVANTTTWSPSEKSVAIVLSDDRLAVFDSETGARRGVAPEPEGNGDQLHGLYAAPPSWSDGEREVFAPGAGVLLDLEHGTTRPCPVPVAGFVRSGVAILWNQPLSFVALEGNRVLERPLEPRGSR